MGFQSGSFTARDLVSAYLKRIQILDRSGPQINSTLSLSPTVLDEADGLDRHLASTGGLRGKLNGIPVLVKDQTLRASSPHTDRLPQKPNADATVDRKLKESGALIFGKTMMAEWATAWFSASSATDYAFTENPYDLDRDVGASSGGSGAAVAANLCLLAVGEDTGGSIRLSSSFCNLTQDAPGPIARTVTDCALMLDCMVGFKPQGNLTGYAATAAALGLPRGGSYAANLSSGVRKIQSATFGVVRRFFGDGNDPDCAAVNSVMESAVAKPRSQGARFVDVHIPNLKHYMGSPLTFHRRYCSDINDFLAGKPDLPLLARDKFRRKVEMLTVSRGLDALVFPSVQVPPPRIDAENSRFWVDGEEVFPTNTFLASITRLPAVSLLAGFTADGLPVGMEIVGLGFQEQHLLELAYGIDSVLQARIAPRGL
ncbi:hypothetical protein CMUS01_10466 [Colletotrichum musicola]|uniref:Amidase domain-containing protein n=1 Tax=Colletotrichum musicola TaxID=2175873 RepID=A0A8H6N935_9PEZI|nr:hypothetical protein CMUS01_10466 [Colletotrichum musicola]